jgi:hypothetical protein
MPPPAGTLSSTRYTIIVDAGSSGSRLIIYSYQDPEAERDEIVRSIRQKHKGKGKSNADVEKEIRWEVEKSLRRLVKVEKGASGDDWMRKAEPGESRLASSRLVAVMSVDTLTRTDNGAYV